MGIIKDYLKQILAAHKQVVTTKMVTENSLLAAHKQLDYS